MRLRTVVAALAAVAAIAGCASPNNAASTPTQPTSQGVTSAPATSFNAGPSTTLRAAPAPITPSSGVVSYLTRNPNGTYACWQGMTTVSFKVTNENGKTATTTFNGVVFELKLSDGYFWFSYPQLPTPLMALIINDKSGFEMPMALWNGNSKTGSGPDMSLERKLLGEGKMHSFKGCFATL